MNDPYGVPTGYVPRLNAAYVADLPAGYDERTRMAAVPGGVVVVHPDHPPLVFSQPTDTQIAAALRALLAQYGNAGYVDVAVLRAIVQSA